MSTVERFIPWFLKIALPLYVIDQITKWWIVFNMDRTVYNPFSGEIENRIPVIDGFFWINRVHNQGMAFGLGNGSAWAPFLFPVILIAAFIGLIVMWKKNGFPTKLSKFAAVLVSSGILGNFTDRMFQGFFLEEFKNESFIKRWSEGYVVDFLDFYFPIINYDYPSFNVADSCITVAAVLLFVSAFFFPEEKKKS